MILFGEDLADDFAEDFAEELGGFDVGNFNLNLQEVGIEEEDVKKGEEAEEKAQGPTKVEKKLTIKKLLFIFAILN